MFSETDTGFAAVIISAIWLFALGHYFMAFINCLLIVWIVWGKL